MGDDYKGIPQSRRAIVDAKGKVRPLGTLGTGTPNVPGGMRLGSTSGVTHVYVDALNGNDNHDGASVATALKTISEVYEKYPWQLMGQARMEVHLLNATTSVVEYPVDALHVGGGAELFYNSYSYSGPAMLQITPATGPATAALNSTTPLEIVNQSNTPDASGNRTRFNFSTAAPGWTSNDLAGSFVRVTTGSIQRVFELPIAESGSDWFIVDSLSLVGVVLAADTIEIVEPAVRIVAPAGVFGFKQPTIMGKSSGLESFGNLPCTFQRMSFKDIHCHGVWGLQYDRCMFTGGLGYRHIGGSAGFINCSGRDGGYLILCCTSTFQPTSRYDDEVNWTNPDSATASVAVTVARRGTGTPPGGIVIGRINKTNQRGNSTFVFDRPISVYRASNAGIFVSAHSMLGVGSKGVMSGSGNGSTGIHVRQNSICHVLGGSETTITGTGGDMKVETGAAISYGTGVGAFEEAAGYNGRFTRALDGTAAAPGGDSSTITTAAL